MHGRLKALLHLGVVTAVVGCTATDAVGPGTTAPREQPEAPFEVHSSATVPRSYSSPNADDLHSLMRQPVKPANAQPLVVTSSQPLRPTNPWAKGIAITPNLAAASSPDGLSLLWHNSTTGDVTIIKLNGATWSGEKATPFNLSAPWRLAASADMNKDGHPDLLWENTDNGLRAVVFMNGTKYNNHYTFLATVSPSTRLAASNDMNGDGNPDLIWSNDATGDHSVWYMNGAAYTSNAPLLNLGPTWKLATVADMNGDNKPDMIWEQSGSGLRAITFMNGATWTGQYSIFAGVDTAWHLGVAGDFNGDGSNDLMWQNSVDGSRVITFMNGPVWSGQYAQFAQVSTAESIVAAAPVQWVSHTTFLKLVTFGDSNTDLGFLGVDPAYKASAYVSQAPNPPTSIRLGPNDPNNPLQLAGKFELRWNAARSEVIRVVNHGIAGTTTGTGRTGLSSPNALEVVGGFTRFEGEVLGRGYPWSGGETLGSAFPSGPVARVQAFSATSADYAYVSLGTNDIITLSVPTIIANLGTMVDLWTAAGLPANHFIITTLPPREPENSAALPALNAAIRSLASSRGLRLIDLAGFTSADDGLTWRRDTLHVTGNLLHYAEEVRDWAADQLMTILTGG